MSPDATSPDKSAGAERQRRAWLSTIAASGVGYLMTLISFIAVPLYLRWLGVEAYGRFLTLLAFMGYLNFADAGLNWGALVLIGHAHGRGDKLAVASLFRHAVVLAFLSAMLAFLAALAVFWLSGRGYRLPMFAQGPAPGWSLLFIGIKAGFMLMTSCTMAMAYGLQEGYWFARLQGFFQLLGVALMLGAAWGTHQIDWVVGVSAIASGVGCVITLACAHRRYADYLRIKVRLSWETFRQQLHTGAKSFLLQGSRLVRTTAPLFLVASYSGAEQVPQLTLPMTLLGVVSGFLFNWSSSLQTAYGEAWAKGDKTWITSTIRQVIERGLGWLMLACCLIVALGQLFVRVWTNGHVLISGAMLGSAVALVVASWVADVGIFALVGINRQGQIALAELLNVVIGIAIGWILCVEGWAHYIGFGVLGATLLTTFLVGRKQLIFWLGSTDFQPALPTLARFVFAALSTLSILMLARWTWFAVFGNGFAWVNMIVTGFVGGAVFFGMMTVAGVESHQWPGLDWTGMIRQRAIRWSLRFSSRPAA